MNSANECKFEIKLERKIKVKKAQSMRKILTKYRCYSSENRNSDEAIELCARFEGNSVDFIICDIESRIEDEERKMKKHISFLHHF